jgi:hypothetical protein
VEVFATALESAACAAAVKQLLQQDLPFLQVSFDLDDRDRILRVQAPHGSPLLWKQVLFTVQGAGVHIELLPD